MNNNSKIPNITKPTSKNPFKSPSASSPVSSIRYVNKKNKFQNLFKIQPDMEIIRNDLLKNISLKNIDIDILNNFSIYIREYTQYLGSISKYDEAEENSKLINIVLEELNQRNLNIEQKNQNENNFQDRLNSFNKQWNEKIEKFDKDTNNKIEELLKKHKEEIEKFENLWSNEMPRKYRKPSPQLLQLKQIEKSLAKSGDYKRAKVIHQDVENLSIKEMEQAQILLIKDYEISKIRLNKKHEKEIEVLNNSRNHEKSLLLSNYEQEKLSIDNRDFVVKKKKIINNKLKNNFLKNNNNNNLLSIFIPQNNLINEEEILLPKLLPPNDPDLIEKEKLKKKEIRKKKEEFQKMNANQTLSKFSLTMNDNSSRKSNKNLNEIVIKGKIDKDELEINYSNQETITEK